jgi:hypothetical protein
VLSWEHPRSLQREGHGQPGRPDDARLLDQGESSRPRSVPFGAQALGHRRDSQQVLLVGQVDLEAGATSIATLAMYGAAWVTPSMRKRRSTPPG